MTFFKWWHALLLVGGICFAVSLFVGDKDAAGVADSMLRDGSDSAIKEESEPKPKTRGPAVVSDSAESVANYDDWHEAEIADFSTSNEDETAGPAPLDQNSGRPRGHREMPNAGAKKALGRDITRALAKQ